MTSVLCLALLSASRLAPDYIDTDPHLLRNRASHLVEVRTSQTTRSMFRINHSRRNERTLSNGALASSKHASSCRATGDSGLPGRTMVIAAPLQRVGGRFLEEHWFKTAPSAAIDPHRLEVAIHGIILRPTALRNCKSAYILLDPF
jgi:hypothetical protein